MIVLATVMSLAVNCHPDPPQPVPPDPPDPPTVIVDTSYDFETEGGSVTITMTMGEAWTANVSGGGNWCTLSQNSGQAGEAVVVITVAANDTYVGRDCEVKLSSEYSVGIIAIHQAQKNMVQLLLLPILIHQQKLLLRICTHMHSVLGITIATSQEIL